jgi:hypothetical protein
MSRAPIAAATNDATRAELWVLCTDGPAADPTAPPVPVDPPLPGVVPPADPPGRVVVEPPAEVELVARVVVVVVGSVADVGSTVD